MLDIEHIASQVRYNCNISDARYWGFYSPCELLLRLRDLYKIEKGLKPWEEVKHKEIGAWIEKREKLWRELEDHQFRDIEIKGKKYKPFNTKDINAVLLKEGFFYGAGYGNLLKPTFFLAEFSEKTRISRYNIYISGREIVRDLSTSPSMLQGNTIIVRYDAMKFFLWGKFEEMRSRRYSSALSNAFSEYGIPCDRAAELSPKELERYFTEITREELMTYIHHELGEASQRRVFGSWWKGLLLKLPYSRAELLVRGLKDILSDTCDRGTLAYIIKNKKAGSLSFYVALLKGVRRIIFPDILKAYDEFIKRRDWFVIEEARIEGYRRVRGYVKILKEIVDRGEISPKVIEDELMSRIEIS